MAMLHIFAGMAGNGYTVHGFRSALAIGLVIVPAIRATLSRWCLRMPLRIRAKLLIEEEML